MAGVSPIPLLVNGRRVDGRAVDEIRPITITAGVLEKATGSSYVEYGNNKILCGVYGPRECIPKHEANPYRAIIRARYMMAPFSTDEHGRMGPNRRSIELSKVIRHVFENVVLLEQYPRTSIDVFMEVLQADGSTRAAAITAASVALANAGIQMKDLVAGISVGKIDGAIIVDLKREEDNFGQADMPMAFASRNHEVLLFQMDGQLTVDEIKQAFELARKHVDKIFALQRDALKRAYEQITEEVGASTNNVDG